MWAIGPQLGFGGRPQWLPLVGVSLDFRPDVPLYVRSAMTFPIDSDQADCFPVGWDASIGVKLQPASNP